MLHWKPVLTVAEKWDSCRKVRLSPLSRRFLRQSHSSATVSLFCDSVGRALGYSRIILLQNKPRNSVIVINVRRTCVQMFGLRTSVSGSGPTWTECRTPTNIGTVRQSDCSLRCQTEARPAARLLVKTQPRSRVPFRTRTTKPHGIHRALPLHRQRLASHAHKQWRRALKNRWGVGTGCTLMGD